MFYYISGKLVRLEPTFAVVDVGGIGYKLTVSGTTYEAMPPRSVTDPPQVTLYTHLAVREDDIELYGFATQAELSSFRMLLTVSGVGPKAALAVLSLLSPEKFALAVCTDDRKTISRANGVGPKTAARIILELKDKMLKENGGAIPDGGAISAAPSAPAGRGKLSEAVDALIVLGYSRPEALTALKTVDTDRLELEAIIRAALKNLMKY